jgi:hypothetical protein
MTKLPMKSCVFSLIALACAFGPAARAVEPAIIAKARAYLGADAALDGVNSVHMVGRIAGNSPGDSGKPMEATIDIVFQKPWQESITILSAGSVVRTALNGTEGWHEEQSPRAAGQTAIDAKRAWNLPLLSPEQAKVLRIDTLENLWFYRGVDRWGGESRDEGPVTQDGIACEKVAFAYTPTVTYHRYFDQATGRLVYSDTEGGAKIREQGEIVAGGIRYPKTIVIIDKAAGGKDSTKTYSFDQVTLNEHFPESFFAVPDLPPVPMHPAPAPSVPLPTPALAPVPPQAPAAAMPPAAK